MTWAIRLLAWEWLNFALEYTATARVELPRWGWAVLAVNLASHPALMAVLECRGDGLRTVLWAEAAVVLLEWGLLALFYRKRRSVRALGGIALWMNAVSFATGLATGM